MIYVKNVKIVKTTKASPNAYLCAEVLPVVGNLILLGLDLRGVVSVDLLQPVSLLAQGCHLGWTKISARDQIDVKAYFNESGDEGL